MQGKHQRPRRWDWMLRTLNSPALSFSLSSCPAFINSRDLGLGDREREERRRHLSDMSASSCLPCCLIFFNSFLARFSSLMRRFSSFSFRCALTSESWTDLDGTDIAFELEAGALEFPMVGSYPLLTVFSKKRLLGDSKTNVQCSRNCLSFQLLYFSNFLIPFALALF
jgi:hypothetical protein